MAAHGMVKHLPLSPQRWHVAMERRMATKSTESSKREAAATAALRPRSARATNGPNAIALPPNSSGEFGMLTNGNLKLVSRKWAR